MVVTFGLMALMPQVERMTIPFVLIYGTGFLFTELGECDNLDLSVEDISVRVRTTGHRLAAALPLLLPSPVLFYEGIELAAACRARSEDQNVALRLVHGRMQFEDVPSSIYKAWSMPILTPSPFLRGVILGSQRKGQRDGWCEPVHGRWCAEFHENPCGTDARCRDSNCGTASHEEIACAPLQENRNLHHSMLDHGIGKRDRDEHESRHTDHPDIERTTQRTRVPARCVRHRGSRTEANRLLWSFPRP